MDATNMADIREVIEIAKSVLKQCMVEGKEEKDIEAEKKNTPAQNAMKTFLKYTGKSFPEGSNKLLSFQELMERRHFDKTMYTNKTAEKFREALVYFYLNQRQIPTLEDINQLNLSKDSVSAIPATGFIVEPLPGMSKGIIIEDPKRTFRRTVYLKKMEQLRRENTHIVYANPNVRLYRCFYKCSRLVNMFIAASPQVGLVHSFFCGPEYAKSTMKRLISCTKLDGHFVLVLEEEDEKETPKLCNKQEMSDWLTANGVCHDAKAHRGELSDLIAKKSLELQLAKSNLDEFIGSIRCEVVRYPKGMTELNFFNDLQKCINLRFGYTKGRQILKQDLRQDLDALTLEEWKSCEKALVETEARIAKEDMMMEEVIDSLKIMAADGELPDSAEGLTDAFNWETVAGDIIMD